jgi:hypothetical protein
MRRHDRLRAHIPVQCAAPRLGDEVDRNPDAITDKRLDQVDVASAAGSTAPEKQPNVTINAALSIGLTKMGEAAGLEPLVWHAIDLGGEPLIEGVPQVDSADPTGACLGWAGLLQLTEYAFDVGDGMRTWFRVEGEWQIEVSTPRAV